MILARLRIVLNARMTKVRMWETVLLKDEVTFLFRDLGFWWLAYAIAFRFVWVTIWASLEVLPLRYKPTENWCASLPKRPPQQTAVCASAHALSELSLVRKALSAAVTSEKRVRKLESSCGVSMEMSSTLKEKCRSWPLLVEALLRFQTCDRCLGTTSMGMKSKLPLRRVVSTYCPFHNPGFISSSGWLSAPPERTLPTASI